MARRDSLQRRIVGCVLSVSIVAGVVSMPTVQALAADGPCVPVVVVPAQEPGVRVDLRWERPIANADGSKVYYNGQIRTPFLNPISSGWPPWVSPRGVTLPPLTVSALLAR